jgi:hypothetical protein
VENPKVLQTCALVSQDEASVLLATDIVVGSISLAWVELLGAEELAIGACVNFTHSRSTNAVVGSSLPVLASAASLKKALKEPSPPPAFLSFGHLVIELDAVFQVTELPAGTASLDTTCSCGDELLHDGCELEGKGDRSRLRVLLPSAAS